MEMCDWLKLGVHNVDGCANYVGIDLKTVIFGMFAADET